MLGRAKPLRHADLSGAHILPSKKEKIIRSTNLWSNRQGKKKVTMNSKHHREHQRTCDILMFMYLMVSKLLYLLMDWETLIKCTR